MGTYQYLFIKYKGIYIGDSFIKVDQSKLNGHTVCYHS